MMNVCQNGVETGYSAREPVLEWGKYHQNDLFSTPVYEVGRPLYQIDLTSPVRSDIDRSNNQYADTVARVRECHHDLTYRENEMRTLRSELAIRQRRYMDASSRGPRVRGCDNAKRTDLECP